MQIAGYILAAVALAGLHLWWWRRYRRQEESLVRERKKNEEWQVLCERASVDSQAQMAALLNSMAEGVLVLDAHNRVRLINRVLRESFELAPDIQGRPLIEVFRAHELLDLAARVESQEAEDDVELDIPGTAARTFHVHGTVYRNSQGISQGAILVFHDLTRLKRLENMRQEFVSNVSHELRTPLSMIKGCVETLLHGAKDDPEASARFLNIVNRHADRLTFLIEDLLILSQLESGRVEFNFQSVDPHKLVSRVLEDLTEKAGRRKVTLINQVPEGLSVRADANRLQQVFYNLIDNAIKYGNSEGRVEVGAQSGPENRVDVWIRDDGPGLPPESVERVFERFYRVDRARSREQGGTGLGLAIVKHIVQAHQGKVWVESQLGRGATFHFTLPVSSAA